VFFWFYGAPLAALQKNSGNFLIQQDKAQIRPPALLTLMACSLISEIIR
jgi:hypothetical protein